MRWFRFGEKVLVALILLIVCGAVWSLIFNPTDGPLVVKWWVIVLGFLLLLLLMLQSVVDRYYEQTIAQASTSDDERFRILYERSPTALVTVDPNGKIRTFNPAAVRLLGTTTDLLKGQAFFNLVVTHTGHDPSMLSSKIRAGVTLNDEELSLQTFDDREIWVLMSSYEDPLHQHRIISLIDKTQSKKVDTAKTEFVALATHQLRTPIAAIRWNFELLEKKLPGEVAGHLQKYLTKVSRNIYRMVSLIDDFLSVSQLETGTFATTPETITLSAYFDNILDEYAEKISEKQLSVVRQEEPAGLTYTADRRLFHIIVSNLVSNAVKYMQSGGALQLGYYGQGGKLVLTVSDNGIGIPRGEQEKLFQRFFRASNARSHQTEGTGLGLYIVKQCVQQLGGTIEVSSTENVLTTFTVTLPLQ